MTWHILLSTAVLVVAMAAARFLPLTARTRYAILLAGFAKFAVPSEAFRLVPVEAVPSPLRVLGGNTTRVVTQNTSDVEWLPLVWAAMAFLVFARWMLLRRRTIAAALQNTAPASERERIAVRDARRTLGVRTAIDVVRSPICEAPAVIRVIRPTIVLPVHGGDDLNDDELRALVLHECAHVTRQDNFVALLQAAATSLLWFHPLVWLASRELTAAREEACDERVADAMQQTDSYVSALAKICHALLAPRTAGVSCMASSRMKERMEHLMSYDTIRNKAWSHRVTLVATLILIATTMFAVAEQTSTQEFALKTDTIQAGNDVLFRFTVTDKSTGRVIFRPEVKTAPGAPAVVRWGTEAGGVTTEFRIDARGTAERGEVVLVATENGKVVQTTTHRYEHISDKHPAASGKYSGEPLSLNLKDADIHDVLKTFGELTGLEIVVEKGIEAKVTMDVVGKPWDQVLEEMLDEHGLIATIEGKTIRVTKK